MPPYVETICYVRGIPLRLHQHQHRFERTLQRLGGKPPYPDLSQLLPPLPVSLVTVDRVKCRLTYDVQGVCDVEHSVYHLSTVRTLRCVEDNDVDYALKSTDRSVLLKLFAQRAEADDVLIVRRGWLTDTTIANIALFDGEIWHTPSTPLLCGTHRAELLSMGVLRATPIAIADLERYTRIRLFNAMIRWGEIDLPITAISPPCASHDLS